MRPRHLDARTALETEDALQVRSRALRHQPNHSCTADDASVAAARWGGGPRWPTGWVLACGRLPVHAPRRQEVLLRKLEPHTPPAPLCMYPMPRTRVVDQAWVGGRRHQRRNAADSPAKDDAAASRRVTRPSLASARSGSVSRMRAPKPHCPSQRRPSLYRPCRLAPSRQRPTLSRRRSLRTHRPRTRHPRSRPPRIPLAPAALTPEPQRPPQSRAHTQRRSRRRFFRRRERPPTLSPPQQHHCPIHSDKRRCASRHSLSNAIPNPNPNPNPSTLIFQP